MIGSKQVPLHSDVFLDSSKLASVAYHFMIGLIDKVARGGSTPRIMQEHDKSDVCTSKRTRGRAKAQTTREAWSGRVSMTSAASFQQLLTSPLKQVLHRGPSSFAFARIMEHTSSSLSMKVTAVCSPRRTAVSVSRAVEELVERILRSLAEIWN